MFAAAFALGSCSSDEGNTAAAEEKDTPVVIDYSSRMTGGVADDGDAFTFLSYMTVDANGNAVAKPELMTSADRRGFYMYDSAEEIFVPVNVNANTYQPSPATMNAGYAQRLTAGTYRTVVMYPAVSIKTTNISELGMLPYFPRTGVDVYASYHDNVDLDLSPAEAFEMNVEHNLKVYDVPTGIKMYPTKSRITVHFFSSTGVAYTIPTGGLKLVWAGVDGWFNAYTGKTYPNYGTAGTYTSDNSVLQVSDVQSFLPGSGTINLPHLTAPYPNEMYRVEDEPVFAADYTGADFYVQPLTLSVTLRMTTSTAPFYADMTSDLPIKLNMERGKTYEFYVDVKSGLFDIWYKVSDWEDENIGETPDNIGETMPYDQIPFDASGFGDWTHENGGDTPDDIGRVN